ncbi:glycosyltransferase family 20-domain-containing protein [Sporodiniella umbellata]|nr:glycosyltransferase family 20-domain-containing protein [Sporodiniella umbellata]
MSSFFEGINEPAFEFEGQTKFGGKVINVVNQIPYHCVLDASNTNQLIIEKLKQLKLQKNPFNVYSEITPAHTPELVEDENLNPISHVQRRSTITTLRSTNLWRLTQRRGYSAMYTALDSLKKDYQTLYIGGTGPIVTGENDSINVSDVDKSEQESLKDLLETKYDILPVFIENKLAFGHYEGYSKQVLWPVMHYMMWSDNVNEVSFWQDYVKVNKIYAEEVIGQYKEGDIVWVHDYHLMLVPQMIREKLPFARVGIFIHTPFPSSEIFRCLPRRKEILHGILGASIVGFQTYDYARHFTSCCTHILGYENTPFGITGHGSPVRIGIYSVGIDLEKTKGYCQRPGVELKARAIRRRYAGKKLIIGRDKLDPIKGVLQKLEAFELFLENFPEWRDKVVLLQVTAPGVLHTPELESKINELVSRINSKYGSIEFSPANLFNQHIDRDEYFALLKVADIGLVTPVIDGMNTSSFEYVVAQEGGCSPLILSEFTGTARSMSSATIVNPWNFKEVARAISDCLSMNEEDKKLKYKQLNQFVTSHTANFWAKSLVKGLMNTQKFGWKTAHVLDFSRVKVEYDNSRKRFLFIDYDGALVPDNSKTHRPSKRAINALQRLCASPKNLVWIISKHTQERLDQYLGHVSRLGLAAEHGLFLKDTDSSKWRSTSDNLDISWKKDIRRVFEYYTERTPGSSIEERKCSIAWNYQNTDPKFGLFQAKECQNHLEQNFVGKIPIEYLANRTDLEVRPSLANKGNVLKKAVLHNHGLDFVLCVSDDKTEDLSRSLEVVQILGREIVQFATFVGAPQRESLADWRIESNEKFLDLLDHLTM